MSSVYSKVLDIFESKRMKYADEQQKRRKEAYAKLPELYNIEQALRDVSAQLVSTVFDKKITQTKLIREYKNKSLELRAQRAELLVCAGLPMDCLELHVDCKKCNDKGFINSDMCECFKKEMKKARYEQSNLGSLLTEQTFKNFNLNFYNEDVNKTYRMSPRENMTKILEFFKKYTDSFSVGSDNLLLTGKTGLGKTFLSTAIARAVIDKGYGVIYETAQSIMTKSVNGLFNDDKIHRDEYDEIFNCDLLIIDDLGAEFTTKYTSPSIYNIVNSRLISKKPTIINTNFNFEELYEHYDERIVSRLTGEYKIKIFFGEDVRRQKRQKK